MEAVEAFLDGEWESLSKLFSCEDSDAMLHCNTTNLLSSYPWNNEGAFDANLYHNTNLESFHSVSQESSSTEIERSLFASENAAGFDLMEEILHLKAQILCNDASQDHNPSQTSKKRPRVAREAKRNAQTKKAKRGAQASKNDEEMINNGIASVVGQSSSMCSSEGDDCNGNASEESESKGSTSMAKNKATKTPATDPQSLYARKRRERINERLRILQNLVPNGTKVDISTMLEEAVQYVKFLQLQIKLLSSDDMWMYAPIAYNGMDMGLYQRINAPNL